MSVCDYDRDVIIILVVMNGRIMIYYWVRKLVGDGGQGPRGWGELEGE